MFYKVVDAILLFGGKDTTFPRNFQGFWGKCRDDDKEKIGGFWYVNNIPDKDNREETPGKWAKKKSKIFP